MFWEYVTYWQGTQQRPDCSNCGGSPMGEGCYHICHNSVHYYSPERERYDAMMDDGSDDIRERYAATVESSQYYEPDDLGTEAANEALSAELFAMTDPLADVVSDDGWRRDYRPLDDIPF